MERGWKIFLIILAVVFLIAAAFVIYTIFQAKQVITAVQETQKETTKADIQSALQGDCSKFTELDKNMQDTINKIKSACSNPVLKPQIEKQAPEGIDICAQVNDPNSDAYKQINEVRQKCSS